MCRRNQLLGCAVLCFGVGLLIGIWVQGGFFAHCVGFAMAAVGFAVIRKK